jgi:hypothetical protein
MESIRDVFVNCRPARLPDLAGAPVLTAARIMTSQATSNPLLDNLAVSFTSSSCR